MHQVRIRVRVLWPVYTRCAFNRIHLALNMLGYKCTQLTSTTIKKSLQAHRSTKSGPHITCIFIAYPITTLFHTALGSRESNILLHLCSNHMTLPGSKGISTLLFFGTLSHSPTHTHEHTHTHTHERTHTQSDLAKSE